MAVPAELIGAKGDMWAARVVTPILAVMIYGAYKFISLGASWHQYLYTYAPLLGGVAALAGLFVYLHIVSNPRKIGWKNLLTLLGFLPYFYALYVIGFLGLYGIYVGSVSAFSIWSIVAGLFWIAIGYWMLNRFYLITEIVRRHDEISKSPTSQSV